jgi:hypothetical protein
MTNARNTSPRCATLNSKSYRTDDQIFQDAIEDDDVREVLRLSDEVLGGKIPPGAAEKAIEQNTAG